MATIEVLMDDDSEEIIVYLNEGAPDGVTEAGVQVLSNKEIDFAFNNLIGVQPLLVSGADIKTINGGSVLGSGNISTGDVYGPAASVDGEIVLFSGGGGKTLKRATITGLAKMVAGVLSAAAAGTDYVAPGGALGTPASGDLSSCTADGLNPVAPKNIPQNSQSVNYTCVLTDAGKHLLHPSADVTARTFTIPANASVAFPIGTVLTMVNQNGGGVITIAITTDVMRLAGVGTTGSRSLAANGLATALKVAATEWIISGVGLT